MTDYKNIEFEIKDRVATIRLNRPDEANGLNLALAEDLASAAAVCDTDPTIKAAILTGNGKFFCAGGDVKAMAAFGDDRPRQLKQLADELHKGISILSRMDIPLITAINGTAAGAGFSIAIVGDLAIAAESAKFTMAYTKVGLSPDGSSSYFLPRLVGLRKAQELMFTNRLLSASEAQDWGLINNVVADDALIAEAEKLAQIFVAGARGSNAAIKKLLLQTFNNGLETQMEIEGRLIAECSGSPDGTEGITAFAEKRQPAFS